MASHSDDDNGSSQGPQDPVTARSRRYFIKTVLYGAAAASVGTFTTGCPFGKDSGKPASGTGPLAKKLDGESNQTCHAVRDGQKIVKAGKISSTHDVIIVGGGPSGLSAAYRLLGSDVLFLEKETRFGGNCIIDEWAGVKMSTGGAFYTESEKELLALYKEIGLKGLPVTGADSLVVNGEAVVDFMRGGANRLPFSQKVRDDFKRSRDDLVKIHKTRDAEELDRITFAELLKPYSPEITRFWDRFGPSNWGGDTANTSAAVGAEAATWAGGIEDARWSFPGGMAGAADFLARHLQPKMGERMRGGCAVHQIEVESSGKSVIVHYLENGEPRAARARTVIVAAPKFFASRIVAGLPEQQIQAMRATKYAPYPTFNVCLDSVGPQPAYDNWSLDTTYTDFIPADWVLYSGKGPAERKTALTVYHPLPLNERFRLLTDDSVLQMVDGVVEGLERHFPGTRKKIVEVRAFRRGHPMFVSTPGRTLIVKKASAPFGPVFFANSDSGDLATSAGALTAADLAVADVRKLLKKGHAKASEAISAETV
jgi:protoporphyrinogen oxidase